MMPDETVMDDSLTETLRDALADLTMPAPPALATIRHRGSVHRRRRRAGFAGLTTGVAAAGAALALALTGAVGFSPSGTAGRPHATPTAPSTDHHEIRTASFVLTTNANGTDTLTLTMQQMLDPAALQQALTQAGVPALVKVGEACTSSPAPPDPVGAGVLTIEGLGSPGTAQPAPSAPTPGELEQMASHTTTVINPAALPAGTELFFGYSPGVNAVFTDLISTSSYSCTGSL